MTTEDRRKEIMNLLKHSQEPIKGTDIAKKLKVSRQVIVQDIAILRAEGSDVMATSSGYLIHSYNKEGRILKSLITQHFNIEQAKEELMVMIDNGATVIDVVVSHPVYGDVKGFLNLNCKAQLDKFVEKVKSGKVEFLSSLTKGIHIHTLEVSSEESFMKIKSQLKEKGYLVEEL